MTQLQVLICAYGQAGLERIASLPHPRIEGVEYVVSWQYGDGSSEVPEALSQRDDFRIVPSSTRGLCVNRNIALSLADAPILLLSDDDVAYTPEGLRNVIQAFSEHPDADYINFRYSSASNPVKQLDRSADLRHPPKGWFTGGSFTIAFRREPMEANNIRFDELFGIGAEFPSGEEDILLNDVIKAGLNPIYLPLTVVAHEGPTTCMRDELTDNFIRTKGAYFTIIRPYSWPARMLAHALRLSPNARDFVRYVKAWLKGHRDYRSIKRKENRDDK